MSNNSNWGNVSMAETEQIDVQIDQNTLGIVLNVFEHIHQNYHVPGVVEKSRVLVSETDIQSIIDRIKDHLNTEEKLPTITMNESDWDIFSILVTYARSGLEGLKSADIHVLDGLPDTYYNWEETGSKPSDTGNEPP